MADAIDPQMAAMLARSAGQGVQWANVLQEARAGSRELLEAVREARQLYDVEAKRLATIVPALAEVRDVQIGEAPLRARLYRPINGQQLPVVLFLHGGSWMFGSIDSHDNLCRHLAQRSACCIVSLGYRLSPESPFPAGLEDAITALEWLHEHASALGCDADRIALAGDSAGGNICAAVALSQRARGKVAATLLIYPSVDARMGSASWAELGDAYRLTREDTAWYYEQYVRDPSLRQDALVSPLLAADVSQFPPTLIQTAGLDPLRDEGEQFARRITSAGGHAEVRRYPGVIHGFIRFEELDVARDAMDDAGRWLRSHL